MGDIMKKFLKEYLRIIAVSITGLIFSLASFYLIINYYHSIELQKEIYIGESDLNYKKYRETLKQIDDNLTKFGQKKSNNSEYLKMYHKLTSCYSVLNKSGTLATLSPNKQYNSYDIYLLGTSFQSELLNTCWALQLSYIKNDDIIEPFKTVSPFLVNNVSLMGKRVDNALHEISNNSSYFYSTKVASITVRDYLSSDYLMIAESYNDFANVILSLSELINENGGN